MKGKPKRETGVRSAGSEPYRIRLPGFLQDREAGLGDAIRLATSYLGIRSCSGCERRAAAMNRWIVFTGKPR